MRKKDWADEEADRFMDMLLDKDNYSEICEAFAKSLRKAARDFGSVPVVGPVGELPHLDRSSSAPTLILKNGEMTVELKRVGREIDALITSDFRPGDSNAFALSAENNVQLEEWLAAGRVEQSEEQRKC